MESKSTTPIVSVVTVVYNGALQIEKTMQSVLNQTYPNVEYIVVDGGSNDGTVEIIRNFAAQIDRWISEPDKGIYDAMNKGIEMATGEWINFMNCGDRFASDNVLELFRRDFSDAGILYGDAIKEYPTFETPFRKFPLSSLWKEMPFSHQATFVRTSLMKHYRFDTAYRLSADYDFLYRAYVHQEKIMEVGAVISRVDFKQGASRNFSLESIRERKRSSLNHDFRVGRWLYYLLYAPYFSAKLFFKSVIGERATAWITQTLKK